MTSRPRPAAARPREVLRATTPSRRCASSTTASLRHVADDARSATRHAEWTIRYLDAASAAFASSRSPRRRATCARCCSPRARCVPATSPSRRRRRRRRTAGRGRRRADGLRARSDTLQRRRRRLPRGVGALLDGPDPRADHRGMDDFLDAPWAAGARRAVRRGAERVGLRLASAVWRRRAASAPPARRAAATRGCRPSTTPSPPSPALGRRRPRTPPAADRFAALQSAERPADDGADGAAAGHPRGARAAALAHPGARLQTRRDGFAALAATPRTRLHELLADVGAAAASRASTRSASRSPRTSRA